MIPDHIYKELSVKRTEYLKGRLEELNIILSPDHFAEVITPVPVPGDIVWNNYYLFYKDPKQVYLFSEKISVEFIDEKGSCQPYIKQDLYI